MSPNSSQRTPDSTADTDTTPPETVAGDGLPDYSTFDGLKPSSSSVPWPGSTFIIRSVADGQVITLLDGQVTLAPPGGRGSIHWACVETKGWLGFQNPVSGKFLGHDGGGGNLRCTVDRHYGWENFCVRMTPEGGFVMLMTHWERLWQVGIKVEEGGKKLAKMEMEDERIIWEFIKV